jgi:hypothetical protein
MNPVLNEQVNIRIEPFKVVTPQFGSQQLVKLIRLDL